MQVGKPEPTSDIVRKAQPVHLGVLGKTPELVAMHAGLECGGEKHPGVQMISCVPTVMGEHDHSDY